MSPRGKVLVLGGGDTAAETACFLCEGCDEVYLSSRRPKFFRINPVNLETLEKKPGVKPEFDS